MTKRTVSVDELYANRHRPYGQVRDGSHHRIESEPSFETGNARDRAFNKPDVQDPEDRHDRDYAGDVADDWRRGGGKGGATGKPSFDRGNAWRQAEGSIHGPPGERGQQRRPEPVTPSAHQKRTGG
jgi:hypothetical protein